MLIYVVKRQRSLGLPTLDDVPPPPQKRHRTISESSGWCSTFLSTLISNLFWHNFNIVTFLKDRENYFQRLREIYFYFSESVDIGCFCDLKSRSKLTDSE